MKKLKLLLIGTGHDHAGDVARTLQKRDDVDLLGCVPYADDGENPTPSKGCERLPRFSLAQALELPELDAVCVETQDRHLTRAARTFTERGIPVHMDKPGGQDGEEFERLFDLAKEKNVPLHLGYMYRYNPGVQKALEMTRAGKLGKLLYMEAEMSCLHGAEKRKWLADYRGGMMNFLGCHLIDLVLTFLGEPEKVHAFNRASSPDVGEDVGTALLEYPTGVSIVRTTAVETAGGTHRHVLIVGEKGSLLLSPTEYGKNGQLCTDLYYSVNTGEFPGEVKLETPLFDRYNAMMDEFLRIVRGEIENPRSYEHEKLLHRVLLAACGSES